MSEVPDEYDPEEAEPRWRDHWQETDVYGYDDGLLPVVAPPWLCLLGVVLVWNLTHDWDA